jgi:hypothetical protein
MSKHRPNSPCFCGSGKKYKKCCRDKELASSLAMPKKEMRFVARLFSEQGTNAGFEIHTATVSHGDRTFPVVQKPISFSTGGMTDLKPAASEAAISISIDGRGDGNANVTGNSYIGAESTPSSVAIRGGKKKLEASLPSGLFAFARVGHQRDTGLDYVDLIYGKKGQSEEVDKNGIKPRPHIALYADGNGKFFRFAGSECEVSTAMKVDGLTGFLTPVLSEIVLPDFACTLQLKYSIIDDVTVVLEALEFSSNT